MNRRAGGQFRPRKARYAPPTTRAVPVKAMGAPANWALSATPPVTSLVTGSQTSWAFPAPSSASTRAAVRSKWSRTVMCPWSEATTTWIKA